MGIDNKLRRGSVRVTVGRGLDADQTAPDPVAELYEPLAAGWVDQRLTG